MTNRTDYLTLFAKDRPPKLTFTGCQDAVLFSRILKESLDGVLEKNYIKDHKDKMAGFVSASIDGRVWWDTMWTRDAGVFLRELTHLGYYNHACILAKRLISLVQKNSDGFYAFPEYFKYGQPGSGNELDGTGAILTGMVLLWERLPDGNPYKDSIYRFIDSPESPIAYIVDQLKTFPLIPGTGEFGGGCGIPGEYINVIQSNMIRLALISVSRMYMRLSDIGKAEALRNYADLISKNMMKYLVSENGTWTWCIRPDTMMIDDAVMNHPVNKGASFINGVLAMCADVYGYDLKTMDWAGVPVSITTFDMLLKDPVRADQFDRHGGWMQFGTFYENMLGGPSYGQGYATQVMLLLDRMDLVEKSLRFIAQSTVNPPSSLKLNRESKYWLYERYYSPDLDEKVRKKEGCGALNLVCVAEPLKIGRMMVGVDDMAGDTVLVIPRIPASWGGFSVMSWPIWTGENVVRCNISYEKENCHERFALMVQDGGIIPKLKVRLGGQLMEFENVREASACT